MIQQFIAAVNTQFLKGKKEDELNALWATISIVPKCPALVKAGPREGEACGKSCVKGQPFCLCHTPREVVPRDSCGFILTSGKRQGQTCLKSSPKGCFCTAHNRVIVPCTFIMKNGQRQGQPCGVTCATGTICKKHIHAAEAEVAPAVVQEVQVEVDQVIQEAVAEVPVERESMLTDTEEERMYPVAAAAVAMEEIARVATVSVAAVEAVEKVTCTTLLKSGPNKGKACGKGCATGMTVCATHRV